VAGASQPDPWSLTGATSTGVDPRLAAILAYTAWWLSGLVFLIIEPQHRGVRFHAAQSLLLFGGLSIVIGLLSVLSVGMLIVSAAAFQVARFVVSAVWIAAVVVWLLLLFKTFQGETWRLPIVGDWAARLAGRK
jgi:uncharacterized membrane protein